MTRKKYMQQYHKIYDVINRDKILKYHREYYFKNKKLILEKQKKYAILNKEERKKYIKQYQKNHKKERNLRTRERYKKDINFKLRCYLGKRMVSALKGETKNETTLNLLGCSLEFIKQHLESKFKPGMSWKNYGKWHIDHIKPCASFDLSKSEEQQKCFHYSNLQPLWAKDNMIKGDRLE
ncbi:MAG: hypothetical protein V1901_03760 [Patescibacteria group bacterium]